MTGAALLLLVVARDGALDTPDGLWLCLYGAAYLVLMIGLAHRESKRAAEQADAPSQGRSVTARVLLLVVGLAVIVVGSEFLVDGAVEIARSLGVSDAVIGLTIVAVGTSAPEFVTTLVSTMRGDISIALGNLLGSSVFNIALILGPTVLVAPATVPVPDDVLALDLVLMVAAAVVCVPAFLTHRRLSRVEGGAFVATYAAYMAWLLSTRL
jgi:cation:H+ antiporter